MVGLKPGGVNSWAGRIYNAGDGKTYAGTAKLGGAIVRVRVCVAFILCKPQYGPVLRVA